MGIIYFLFFILQKLVPADGVKGKTWGPSSGASGTGSAVRVRPNIVDESGQSRWSKSVPSLEKSPRNPHSSAVPTVTSVPELGKNLYLTTNL